MASTKGGEGLYDKLPVLNWYIKLWSNKQKRLRAIIKSNQGLYKADDIRYAMETREFVDQSLVYDNSIFKFKPPIILKTLWVSTPASINNFVLDVIEVEKAYAKDKEPVEKIMHALDLKWIANYTLKKRFPDMPLEYRKSILAGNYRPRKTHFTQG